VSEMNKKLLLFKRKKAKELHEKGWSNREIARHLLASKIYFLRIVRRKNDKGGDNEWVH